METLAAVLAGPSKDANCQLALGLESGAILNSQLSSSTKVSVLQGPRYARLHRRDGHGGWTAETRSSAQYLTVDLIDSTRISGVATQGRYETDEYTLKYKLQYSNNGNSWTTYSENGKEKVFPGNSNADKVHRNDISSPFTARFVRINPTQWNVAPSMRLELYGCLAEEDNTATFDGSSYIKYDVSNPNDYIKTEEELIQFKMRTETPDGIILASVGTQTDYITLQLKQGKVVLSIDLGTSNGKSGATLLEAGSLLDDNQWHFVQYKRKGKTISLTIDGVTVSGTTNGYFKRLDLDTVMTVGGASLTQFSSLIKSLQVPDSNTLSLTLNPILDDNWRCFKSINARSSSKRELCGLSSECRPQQ
ncbi:contactin-associated protein-like 2 [Amphiura filiformis]|uniref:contactin-associated protein-like 2 n=1 Tax=Amphiura filiformis TaxID=82378 RepID=UPI003B20FEBB